MLNVKNASRSYGNKTILHNLNFTVQPGEIIGLVGENGAGKSTLLNILASIQKPSSGTIHLNNLNSTKEKKLYRKLVGFVPQDLAIWDTLTVRENMLFFEKLGWVKKSESNLRTICKEMALDKWNEQTATLSGGQKRKLNLAISLIHEPALLLLDEPTVGIDMRSKAEIIAYLKQIAFIQKTMILYTSHDMDEIKNLCHRVICIGNDPFYQQLLESANKPIISF